MNERKKKCIITYILLCSLFLLGGCGKDDDKLVMITTEKSNGDSITTEEYGTDSSSPIYFPEDDEEQDDVDVSGTEEASKEEKSITMADIYYANIGDMLLLNETKGYSKNTIYYSGGSEIFSEFEYIGFDENGVYIQATEDSDGKVWVLDNTNQCWYEYVDNRFYTQIYPEEGIAAHMISYTHNNMIMTVDECDNQTIKDVYRKDGSLIVEAEDSFADGENITYKYILENDYRISEIYSYDAAGEQLSYSWITKNAVYNAPDFILDIIEGKQATRSFTVKYANEEGFDSLYTVPVDSEIKVELLQHKAYFDKECTKVWYDKETGTDETIYLMKN